MYRRKLLKVNDDYARWHVYAWTMGNVCRTPYLNVYLQKCNLQN